MLVESRENFCFWIFTAEQQCSILLNIKLDSKSSNACNSNIDMKIHYLLVFLSQSLQCKSVRLQWVHTFDPVSTITELFFFGELIQSQRRIAHMYFAVTFSSCFFFFLKKVSHQLGYQISSIKYDANGDN